MKIYKSIRKIYKGKLDHTFADKYATYYYDQEYNLEKFKNRSTEFKHFYKKYTVGYR